MPENFTKVSLRWIGIYICTRFLLGIGYNYLFQNFGSYSIKSIVWVTYILNFLIFAFSLGFGVRDLCRSNYHKNSVTSVFAFAGLLILIPTLSNLLFLYVQSNYDDSLRNHLNSRFYITSLITGIITYILYSFFVLTITSQWRIFRKAEKPPYHSFIPFLNVLRLVKIAQKPLYWIVLLLIPPINIIVAFLLSLSIATSFDKKPSFGIGLFFLPFIFYPILGFGSARYKFAQMEDQEVMNIEDHLIE